MAACSSSPKACDVPVRWAYGTCVCHARGTTLIAGEVEYRPEPLEPPLAEAHSSVAHSPPTTKQLSATSGAVVLPTSAVDLPRAEPQRATMKMLCEVPSRVSGCPDSLRHRRPEGVSGEKRL